VLTVFKRNLADAVNNSLVLINSKLILNSTVRDLNTQSSLRFSMSSGYTSRYYSDILADELSEVHLNTGSVLILSGFSNYGLYNKGKLKINGSAIYPSTNNSNNATIT